jgi:hypothetical protein
MLPQSVKPLLVQCCYWVVAEPEAYVICRLLLISAGHGQFLYLVK